VAGPDRLAMESADRLYISNPGHGCVWVVDPHGRPLYRIQWTVGRMTMNCALTPDERSVVITKSESGSILIGNVPPA
jgi:gluconolactonase